MSCSSLGCGRRFVLFSLALLMAVAGAMLDAPLQAQAVEEEQAAAPQEEAAAVDEDLFVVPDGDADALQEYIMKLARTRPQGDTPEEQMAFSRKALTSLVEAAGKLLAASPNEEQTVQGHGIRLQALLALGSLGDESSAEKLTAAIDEARKSDNEQIQGMGWQAYINERIGQWTELKPEEQAAFRDEIMKKIAAGPQAIDVQIVGAVASNLDGTDNEFVVKFVEEARPLFEKSDDEEVKAALADANFDGMLRRLTLLGNPMKLEGVLLSGKELDWESYRGKVVLVDFWATWCGPCRAEVPNILELYKGYHDKGFEVVGVSLDEAPEDAQQYAEEMGLPWDSLFPENEEERGWNNPMAAYYGITGIPTAILVDKDGKVVHMEARGEVLGEQLQKLLGDPVKQPAAEEKVEETKEPAAAK